ncbi:MAG: fimbrillin family protein [Bacteroides sp.]
MKKRMLSRLAPALLLLLAAVLAGCNKNETDDNQLPDGKQPVTLIAGIGQAQTRTAAGTTEAQTIWTVGDKIGFFAEGYDNIPCTATAKDGSGWSGLYWKDKTSLKNIKAYYPYREGGYQEKIYDKYYDTFTIQEDQSTEEKYYQSDVLKGTAAAGETAFNSPVTLNFTHVMSKLTVQLTTEDENVVPLADLTGATVQVTNMYTKGYFYTNDIFYNTGTYGHTITMLNRSNDTEARFQAIAIPDTYLSYSNEIIITSAGGGTRVYKGKFPDVGQFTANQQHVITFTVKKNLTVTVTSDATGGIGWNEGATLGDAPTESSSAMYLPDNRTDIKNLNANDENVTGNSYSPFN